MTASALRPLAQRDFTVPSATSRTGCRLGHRQAVHVDEDERHPLALGEPVQRLPHVEARLDLAVRVGAVGKLALGQRPWSGLSRRSRSRQALTTIRCSQVVTAASPR